ncbi:MAG: dihydroorotase [Candidatus Binataceae bacterium]|nr:dihydroorotase [Candidatus Binataceae bacterium]
MRPLLLRGGRVIDPASAIDRLYDVLVMDGEIDALEPAGNIEPPPDTETLDCTGLWVVPGLIDVHVHLRDPGFPQKETIATGLRAAAASGFTTVAAMANTSPVDDTPEIAHYMLERAREVHAARLIPVSAVTKSLAGRELVDFAAMATAGARLFSDDGIPIDDEAILVRAFREAAQIGFAISLHEEDRTLTGHGACNAGEVSKRLGVAGIPVTAETHRVRRDLAIAVGAGAPVHIAHVSTAESIELIRAARQRGANVTCEATPHHFMLDDSAFARFGPNAKMAPPLRSQTDVEAIRAALADGTIDVIATDHAPHDHASKHLDRLAPLFPGSRAALLSPGARETLSLADHHAQLVSGIRDAARLSAEDAELLASAANGIVGLETALGLTLELVHRGIIDASRMVTLMSTNPARLLRLDAQGTLTPGAQADITVIDPNYEWTVEPAKFISMSRNTPFTGRRLKGRAAYTVFSGEIIHLGASLPDA